MNARDVIIRPVVTEATMKMSSDENKITFVVAKKADKLAVKRAVEEIYNIKPLRVNIINVHPRLRRVGRYSGMTNAYKKAIVFLPEGQSIDIFNNGNKEN